MCASVQSKIDSRGRMVDTRSAWALLFVGRPQYRQEEAHMLSIMFVVFVLIIVAFTLLSKIPAAQYASEWGNDPSGGVGLVLAVLGVLLLLGHG